MLSSIITTVVTRDLSDLINDLKENLTNHQFKQNTTIKSIGWTPITQLTEEYFIESNGFVILKARESKRTINAQTVKNLAVEKMRTLQESGEEIEEPKSILKTFEREIREEKLPKQTPSQKDYFVILDVDHSRIYTNAPNGTNESILTLLRKTIGTLPVVLLSQTLQTGETFSKLVRKQIIEEQPILEKKFSIHVYGKSTYSINSTKNSTDDIEQVRNLYKPEELPGLETEQTQIRYTSDKLVALFAFNNTGKISSLKFADMADDDKPDDLSGLALVEAANVREIVSGLITCLEKELDQSDARKDG